MTALIKTSRRWLARKIAGSADFLNDPNLWRQTFFFGHRTASGEFINPESSMQLSAYYAAIRNIAEDVGKLPLFVFRSLAEGGKEKAVDSPIFRLIRLEPNPNIDKMTFWQTMTQWALAWHGGFAEIQRDLRGDPVALWPIHPTRVWIRIKKIDGVPMRVYQVRSREAIGHDVELLDSEVFHLRGIGSEHAGFSTTHNARELLGLAAAQQQFSASFFGNNAAPSGILKIPEALDEESEKNLRTSWERAHAGPRNANRVAILEMGSDFTPLTMPLKQAQLLEARRFSVEEIARYFRIPPHKIQQLDRATFNNIDAMNLDYVTDTLMPWLVRIEMEANRKLLPRDGDEFVEHKVQGLLRGDIRTRFESYKTGFNIGIFSINEMRELENLNPINGGDRHFVQQNLMELETGNTTNSPGLGDDALARLRPVILDAARRCARKEANAISRANGRCMRAFYDAHREHMRENFTAAWHCLTGADPEPLRHWTGLRCREAAERKHGNGKIRNEEVEAEAETIAREFGELAVLTLAKKRIKL